MFAGRLCVRNTRKSPNWVPASDFGGSHCLTLCGETVTASKRTHLQTRTRVSEPHRHRPPPTPHGGTHAPSACPTSQLTQLATVVAGARVA